MSAPEPVRKAVIPAAGLGTRFLPATKAVPKEMLPIVDVPVLQMVVEEAVSAAISDIVLVNGRNKSAIEDHFDHAYELEHTLHSRGMGDLAEKMGRISTLARLIAVRQKHPLGLGHAILCAHNVVGDAPVAVLLPDDIIDCDDRPAIGQLCDVYEQTNCGTLAIVEVPKGQEHLYGIVVGDKDENGHIVIEDLVEKPEPGTAPSQYAVVGRYILPEEIWPLLSETPPGKGGEIQLTDALRGLAKGRGLRGVILKGIRFDTGHTLGYLHANLHYALKRQQLRGPLLQLLEDVLRDNR